MKLDGSDWEKTPEKSETEKLFDSLLFDKLMASVYYERLRIVKELERLLPEDQAKFAEYLSDVIALYKNECSLVLDVDVGSPVPEELLNIYEELQNIYYDEDITLLQYLCARRIVVLDYLQHILKLWNNKQTEDITTELKDTHKEDVSFIYNAKKRAENVSSLLENLTMKAIEVSTDTQKNEALRKSFDELRNKLNEGLNV